MDQSQGSEMKKFPKIIRKASIQERLPVSTTTIYEWMKLGTFPPNINLGNRAVGWIESEVEAVVNAMISGADRDSLEQLVADLVANRNEP